MLLSAVSFGSPNLSGQYWFGSLSVTADGSAPWGKRGTVSITGNQWLQQWEDYDGPHAFSSTFTTTAQPDGSININFPADVNVPAETYNVAFNGDVMIHAGSVLGGGEEGIDILTRKATNVDVNDLVGDYSFFGHWLRPNDRWDEIQWGKAQFDPNGIAYMNYTSSDGYSDTFSGNWTLDDVNGIVDVAGTSEPALLSEGGIFWVFQNIDLNSLGYNILIKKAGQMITMAEIAGTYQVRFLQTGPGGVPYTCGQGTCVIEAVDDANGILLVDAYYSNGEHSVTSKDCSVGPGNEFHVGDDGVPDGIISPDKNLILGVEYLYENPPTRTEDDWIGGTFFIRMPENIGDFNGDGIVDAADTAIMLAHWGEDYPLCDIAPPPSGDGVVDIQDLIALTEQMSEVRPPSETVEVNEDNDGGQIEIEQGRILVVTLESNPSSGYMWELAENNKSILKQLGQAKFQPSETSEPPIPGSGGWESFRFKAIGAGQVTLKLVYHRSWEDVEPLKTFSIQVAVP